MPSGDHDGLKPLVTSLWSVPSASITHTSPKTHSGSWQPLRRVNAICFPSGDQLGSASRMLEVSLVGFSPTGPATQMPTFA